MVDNDIEMHLHVAVINDCQDKVKNLVLCGADINKKKFNGWTPIHRAVCCFHINMVQYLVSLGANINGLQKFRSLGRGLLLRYSHFLFLFAPQAQVIIELVPAVLATHK
jgi:ankyrin repeat protein